MSKQNKFCAKCQHFTLVGAAPADLAAGRGECKMFEKPVDWDDRFCVLFTQTKEMSKRVRWIEKMQSQKGEVNGTEPGTAGAEKTVA